MKAGTAGRPAASSSSRRLLPALLSLSVLAPFTLPAAAQTVTTFVKNLGQETKSNAPTFHNLTRDSAQAFTTGDNAVGYKLTSVKLKFRYIVQTGTADRITVAIHADSSGKPGTKVGTLTNPTRS